MMGWDGNSFILNIFKVVFLISIRVNTGEMKHQRCKPPAGA